MSRSAFTLPGSMEIYTHKVSVILRNGMIQTRGIANPTHDPWLITRCGHCRAGRLVGLGSGLGTQSVAHAGGRCPGVGAGEKAGSSGIVTIVGPQRMTALAVIPLCAFDPLVRGQLAEVAVKRGSPHQGQARVVNTGLLSAGFHPVSGGRSLNVASGHVGMLSGALTRHGAFYVHETLSLRPMGLGLCSSRSSFPRCSPISCTFRAKTKATRGPPQLATPYCPR